MTNNLLRTFLSIPVIKDIKSKKNMLYSTLEDSKLNINWVRNTNIHLTVKFIGQTPEKSIKKIIESVSGITSSIKPFSVKVSGTGCFPTNTRPKTLWLGISGGVKPLMDMVKEIENKLFEIGFSKDKKEFIPHITVARISYPQKVIPDVDIFLKSSYDVIDLDIDRMQFFSSELLPNGAIYSLLKTFPLGEKT
ncbi:MAG: RNA 2',3'-cyclic phosphodiesterase [Candidatus Neomarinimicrobiota bacterium]